MPKWKNHFSICIFFLAICAGTLTAAGMMTVCVDSKPLNTEYIIIMDEAFIPAKIAGALLKETITWDPSTLWVKIGEKETSVKGLQVEARVYLPLKALAREIGYGIEWDQGKELLNIDTSRKVEPSPGPGASPGPGETTETPPTRKRKAVTIRLFKEDLITNMLEQISAYRIYADVNNERARPVDNVEAHCIFRLPEGNVYYDDVVKIDRLAPGESRRVIFYSTNPLNEGKLVYELTIEIKKKQEKE